jgi:transitional endoplasmic reticulum ATPase
MKLLVKPLDREHAGRGITAVDHGAMEELGVCDGEFVTIEGETGSAVARVQNGRNTEKQCGVVDIDGQVRETAGVRIDQYARVEPAEVTAAESIAVAVPDELGIRGDIESYLHGKLAGRAVEVEQTVPLALGFGSTIGSSSRRIPVRVAGTEPAGTVAVTESTTIELLDEPVPETTADHACDAPGCVRSAGVTYDDIGGLDCELEQVREMIELPMAHPELFQALGIEPPRGVLLHGPPGTGKTLIARAMANEIDARFEPISGPELMSNEAAESEQRLNQVFESAERDEPTIVFIDELDAIAPERGEIQSDLQQRVGSQLLSLMDGLENRSRLTVIGTTDRLGAVDSTLRSGQRFDREIEVGVPDTGGRTEVLKIHTREMPMADSVDLEQYAENTHGFVGADLESLVREAAMNALRRVRPDLDLEGDRVYAGTLETLEVTDADIRLALRRLEPSALNEVFVEKPDVTWDDVGGFESIKRRLKELVQWPLEHPDAYGQVNLHSSKGIMLHGPPGTGKALLAKAVAGESGANFISVNGPELFDKYASDSKNGVREIFSKARENAPTVIFFTEIDSIATGRSQREGNPDVDERVVSQLLTELDRVEELEEVVVIAATNRSATVDDGLTRAGRIDNRIELGAPDEATRREILEIHARDRPLAEDVDFDTLAADTEYLVGADLSALCREAAINAVREHIESGDSATTLGDITLTQAHFEAGLERIEERRM